MTAARRSPWLDDRTALLLNELSKYEMTLPEDVARQFISDHLDEVATLMRIGRAAARFYVTDDVIAGLAHRLLGTAAGSESQNVVSIVSERQRRKATNRR